MDTPTSRSSGGDVDGFFASPDGSSGGSGGYKARDMAARAGGGGALTPVIKRRAILRGDRSPPEHEASFVETEAAAAAASALLAVRSSEGPKRYVFWEGACFVRCTCVWLRCVAICCAYSYICLFFSVMVVSWRAVGVFICFWSEAFFVQRMMLCL